IVGSSLAKLGRHDEAKREIDAALQIDPTNSDALYHAAVSAHLRGDDPSALGWLNRAVRAGYGATNAERDPEWNAVRSRPEFREALKTS
ncbi:MAG: tetratricopeptide repeat protein, partial [Thermoanaerobaculia bacterium]